MRRHPRPHSERNDGRADQNPHRQIPERIVTQLQERFRRRVLKLIDTIQRFTLLARPFVVAQTLL